MPETTPPSTPDDALSLYMTQRQALAAQRDEKLAQLRLQADAARLREAAAMEAVRTEYREAEARLRDQWHAQSPARQRASRRILRTAMVRVAARLEALAEAASRDPDVAAGMRRLQEWGDWSQRVHAQYARRMKAIDTDEMVAVAMRMKGKDAVSVLRALGVDVPDLPA